MEILLNGRTVTDSIYAPVYCGKAYRPSLTGVQVIPALAHSLCANSEGEETVSPH